MNTLTIKPNKVLMHKEDSITLEDLKQGSDRVLKYVYEENRSKFLNFARRYDLPKDDLVDIYQEAYITFYDNVMNGRIKEFTSTISTYIISIGKYMIFDRLKHSKKTMHVDFDVSVLKDKDELIDKLDLDKDDLTREQQLLYKHFTALGKRCKELLDLFYYRGFTINDILMHTDYNSENVVKSTKSRCMKTLKERINNTN